MKGAVVDRFGNNTSEIPHGEPYAGKLLVAPLRCYGVTGRFDEG